MELNIQKFLKCNLNALDLLVKEPYYINIKRHPKYNNLVQFTYDMIESPKGDSLVKECRGLILNESDNWNIIAYPFNRFFNEGEFYAAPIDWNSARVQEKIDGTLIIMYWYDNKWQIATRGSPDASGPVGDFSWYENIILVPLTFSRLFWHSAEYWLKGLSKSGEFCHCMTFMWELTSPYNRVVCDYTKEAPLICKNEDGEIFEYDEKIDVTGYSRDGSRITLIGVRNNTDGQEYPLDAFRDDIYYIVEEFPLTNLQQVIDAAAKLDPIHQEGFVVVDGNFNRIKIKSPAYVAIHHIRDGNPRKRLMEIIQSGENEEMLAYKILDEFPAEKKMYEEILEKVEKLILQTEQLYDTIKDIEVQKEFALIAVKSPMAFALFGMRKGLRDQKTIRQIILSVPTKKLMEIIDKIK